MVLVSFLFFTFFAIKLAYIILLLCLYDLLLHLADSLFAGVTFLIHDSNVNVETALFLLKNICKPWIYGAWRISKYSGLYFSAAGYAGLSQRTGFLFLLPMNISEPHSPDAEDTHE